MAIERRRLSDDEIAARLTDMDGWVHSDGSLRKTFSFESYSLGLAFSVAVGFLADTLDHHPDLTVSYRKVAVSVNTHDVGGVSDWDFELARRIEATVSKP